MGLGAKMKWVMGVLGLLFTLWTVQALAQEQVAPANPPAANQPAVVPSARKLVVATREIPPFIIKQGDSYAGFSADLWRELADRTGTQFEWLEKKNVGEILAAVENAEADLGIAAISITSEREQRFDFSQPMFESGLQVMVPEETDTGFSPAKIFTYFTQGAMPYLLGILALLILIPGHFVWWAERSHADSPFSKHYFPASSRPWAGPCQQRPASRTTIRAPGSAASCRLPRSSSAFSSSPTGRRN